MITDLQHEQDLQRLAQESREEPVFLLKHSTRCPISAAAWREYQRFGQVHPRAQLWRVLVIENTPMSRQVARVTGVGHESPQILLFSNGQVVWHASHWRITKEAMTDALSRATRSSGPR
jgi:bacillithiol system protein YtxJ